MKPGRTSFESSTIPISFKSAFKFCSFAVSNALQYSNLRKTPKSNWLFSFAPLTKSYHNLPTWCKSYIFAKNIINYVTFCHYKLLRVCKRDLIKCVYYLNVSSFHWIIFNNCLWISLKLFLAIVFAKSLKWWFKNGAIPLRVLCLLGEKK